VIHLEAAARHTVLDEDLVGLLSKCLGSARFQHLHNDYPSKTIEVTVSASD